MNVFGYLYYKFSRPYKKVEGQDYYVTPILLLSMCQGCNIMSLLPFIIRFNVNNWILCGIVAFFVLMNFIYFLSRGKREQYEHLWSKEKGAKKRWGSVAAIAYIVFSYTTYLACMSYDLHYTGWEWDPNWSWRWA